MSILPIAEAIASQLGWVGFACFESGEPDFVVKGRVMCLEDGGVSTRLFQHLVEAGNAFSRELKANRDILLDEEQRPQSGADVWFHAWTEGQSYSGQFVAHLYGFPPESPPVDVPRETP